LWKVADIFLADQEKRIIQVSFFRDEVGTIKKIDPIERLQMAFYLESLCT